MKTLLYELNEEKELNFLQGVDFEDKIRKENVYFFKRKMCCQGNRQSCKLFLFVSSVIMLFPKVKCMEDLSKFNQIDSLYEIALLLVDLF